MITNHVFKPCWYSRDETTRWSAEAFGLCLNPNGMDRCHVKDCGRRREEHCCDGNDPACPTHGVAASNARQDEF